MFAVVLFPDPENPGGVLVEAVPQSWIKSLTKCAWPKKKDVRTMIKQQTAPAEDWKIFKCTVVAQNIGMPIAVNKYL